MIYFFNYNIYYNINISLKVYIKKEKNIENLLIPSELPIISNYDLFKYINSK